LEGDEVVKMSRKSNVIVTARECRGNSEKMIRKFMKKVKKERIIEQVKDRRRYKKPSVLKKQKRLRAERNRQKEKLKRIKAQERRNRRNY
jgi:ribosomal protein S21